MRNSAIGGSSGKRRSARRTPVAGASQENQLASASHSPRTASIQPPQSRAVAANREGGARSTFEWERQRQETTGPTPFTRQRTGRTPTPAGASEPPRGWDGTEGPLPNERGAYVEQRSASAAYTERGFTIERTFRSGKPLDSGPFGSGPFGRGPLDRALAIRRSWRSRLRFQGSNRKSFDEGA